MRVAILADIHGNLEALEAVLADAAGYGEADECWCLGDIMGYGPDPGACLALVREKCRYVVAGNHDMAAAGVIALSDFNDDAAKACLWTSKQLSPKELTHLKTLEMETWVDDFTLVHGSPKDPIWEYLVNVDAARDNFSRFETPCCLVGHSHVPLIFEEEHTRVRIVVPLPAVTKVDGKRFIINPGSVGQPRDRDSRASYMIYDSVEKTVELRRVSYDITMTQEKMTAVGLPQYLIKRLTRGV